MTFDIWTWIDASGDAVDESGLGLVAEARRLADDAGGGTVTVMTAGQGDEAMLRRLGDYGADRVVRLAALQPDPYHGDIYADALVAETADGVPAAMLFVHDTQTADLAPRIGVRLTAAVMTRAVDARMNASGDIEVARPVANGYQFETVAATARGPVLITFLPAVLANVRPSRSHAADIESRTTALSTEHPGYHTLEIIDADPETLDIEDADIVVAAGRGVGNDQRFDIIGQLARVIGGSVAGTRPVIDWQLLPFERQIGQTGKTVTPRLVINCGISGANEYTAGIEKAKTVIAINSDPKARIFRFADLGIVGDLHEVLPLLVQRLKEMAEEDEA